MTKGLRDQAEGRILWWMTLGLTVAAYWLCASNILFTRTMALCSAISVVVMWAAADWLWRRIRPAVHRRLFRVTRLEEGHDEAPARPSERGRMRQARRFEMAMNLLLPLAAFSLGTFGTQNAVGLLASAYFSRTGVYPHLNWYSDPNPVILSRFPVPSWMDDYQKLLDVVGKAPQSTITVRYEGDDGRTRLLKFTRAPGLGFVMQVVRAQGLCQYSTCTGCCQAADGMFHVLIRDVNEDGIPDAYGSVGGLAFPMAWAHNIMYHPIGDSPFYDRILEVWLEDVGLCIDGAVRGIPSPRPRSY